MILSAFFAAFALTIGYLFTANAYPYQPAFSKLKANVDCKSNPAPLSYHVHVTYMLTNEKQIQEVQLFREQAIKHFTPLLNGLSPVCQGTDVEPSGRYDNGRFCFIYDHDLTNDTLGPFAVGEWSAFVPVNYYSAVVPWFVQNRGQFNLLVHPNTGCEYEDHSIWAQWSGSAWNMDMSIFTQWTQTNEFGEVLGNSHNPSCLTRGGTCGFGSPNAPGYGPTVLCCSGSACSCDSADGACYCR